MSGDNVFTILTDVPNYGAHPCRHTYQADDTTWVTPVVIAAGGERICLHCAIEEAERVGVTL